VLVALVHCERLPVLWHQLRQFRLHAQMAFRGNSSRALYFLAVAINMYFPTNENILLAFFAILEHFAGMHEQITNPVN